MDPIAKTVLRPQVLLLASRFDLSCDYVVAQLRQRGVTYFRLNSEDFERLSIVVIPDEPGVYLYFRDLEVHLKQDELKSVYFRRAVYPREPSKNRLSVDERLGRAHRSAFMRNFMVFDSCKWINHPAATYRAEQKAVQLSLAHRLGFSIPRTVITNCVKGVLQVAQGDQTIAVKGLDTVLVWQDGLETFGYTSLVETASTENANLSSAPLIAQEALENKLDLRITVVGDQVFCASVTLGGNSIRGDWRLEKSDAEFQPFALPEEISEKCLQFTRSLGLVFGAIDLALQDDTFFFLEINPTGEWAWLVDQSCLSIDKAITDSLLNDL